MHVRRVHRSRRARNGRRACPVASINRSGEARSEWNSVSVGAHELSAGAATAPREAGRFAGIEPRQIVKIVVYGLLLVNFGHYLGNDMEVARHTWHEGWRLKDWTAAFATSLDETAWFALLFLLEIETYLLSDEAFTRARIVLLHVLRALCYVVIAHTVFAAIEALADLDRAVQHSGVALCSLLDGDLSFARNLAYTELDAANCGDLSADTVFFQFAQGQAITDRAGMAIEWQLAWADLIDAVVWLLTLFAIEVMVRLQERGVVAGTLMLTLRVSKALLYGVLWCIAAYWAWRGHWVFAWDESLWILGFVAIDMNLAEWRQTIVEEGAPSLDGAA